MKLKSKTLRYGRQAKRGRFDQNTLNFAQLCLDLLSKFIQNNNYMKQICKFRQGADILATQSGLATSIPDAMDFGRIKDTSVPSSYNGQKSLQEVGKRIGEPFDIIEFDRTYTKVRKSINDSEYAKKQSESSKK